MPDNLYTITLDAGPDEMLITTDTPTELISVQIDVMIAWAIRKDLTGWKITVERQNEALKDNAG